MKNTRSDSAFLPSRYRCVFVVLNRLIKNSQKMRFFRDYLLKTIKLLKTYKKT